MRSALRRMRQWLRSTLLMQEQLARAREATFGADDPGFAAFERARAALEAAELLLRSEHELPRSRSAAPAATLLREALRRAMIARVAHAHGEAPSERADRDLWEAYRAVGGERAAAEADGPAPRTAEQAFLRGSDGEAGDAAPSRDEEDARVLRQAVRQALAPLDAAAGALGRARAKRWLRWAFVGLILLGMTAATWQIVRWRTAWPNVALGKPTQASSLRSGYESAAGLVDGITDAIGAETNSENQPWVQIDLGESRPLTGVRIYNRADCCQERALPLVLEISADGEHFLELARRTTWFGRWSVALRSRAARFVRLRTDSKTSLHLSEIEIYAASR